MHAVRTRLFPLIPLPVRTSIRRLVGRPTPYMTPSGGFTSSWDAPVESFLDPAWHEQSHYLPSQELVVAYLDSVLRGTSGKTTLLDAPCGNGRLYRGLERAGLLDRIEYTGLDVTANLIEACRQLMPGVSFIQGSVESLPFEDCAFDVIVAQHIIRHLESYDRAVQELLRVAARFVVVVDKRSSEGSDKKGVAHYPNGNHYWVNEWDSVRLKRFAREHGAAFAFTLNDETRDDPEAQYIYVFAK